ncbi:hypothetical protein IFM89_010881 [Coptis chinensis]|uniref:Uncharacterized protein n=1 Tax=Coptis chinensis TaxID=261450 RepID=A0A835I1C1_9MAGN|nr:hypothetical protein IFM89_010881 [Coptis chinensis]
MPGLPQRNVQFNSNNNNAYSTTCSTGSISSNGIWSKHPDDIGFDQLQKLPPHLAARALKIDKRDVIGAKRKNLYCSRCNGLLLEGFSQIVMDGKSQQLEGGHVANGRMSSVSSESDVGVTTKISVCEDDNQDPSVHPRGRFDSNSRRHTFTFDRFLEAKSPRHSNVFNGATVRGI